MINIRQPSSQLYICGSHEKSRETSTREETGVCRGSPYIESLGLPRSQAAVRKNQAMSSLQKERLVFRRKNLITFASCLGLILQRKTLASSLVLSCNARSVRQERDDTKNGCVADYWYLDYFSDFYIKELLWHYFRVDCSGRLHLHLKRFQIIPCKSYYRHSNRPLN